MDLEALLSRARDVRTSTVDLDGIAVTVREPTVAANATYSAHWAEGKRDEAIAGLLQHCVIDASGKACLSAEQALQLATAGSKLCRPLMDAILDLARPEKKPHAPGADAVQAVPAAGAATV